MKQFRLFGIVLVIVMTALVPLASVANAQTGDQAGLSVPVKVAQAKAQANLVNDLAQCELAASGAKYLRGGVGISQPLPAGVSMPSCSPASGTATTATSSSSSSSAMKGATCVAATRALTQQEFNTVNEYEIMVAKANSAHTPVPAMSPDVAALIGCGQASAASLGPFQATVAETFTAAPCSPVPSLCVSAVGTGDATLVGPIRESASVVINLASNPAPGCTAETRETILSAANGDQLMLHATGQSCATGPTTVAAVDSYVVTGWTGRFSGASGSGTITVTIDQASGKSQTSFNGVLSTPG